MAAEAQAAQYDLVGKMIDWESGDMNEAEATEFFQHLIDTGLAWELQGSYGRAAEAMIKMGYCHAKQ